jgi:3'(2'), 5'-bisphosphate nucleotidase
MRIKEKRRTFKLDTVDLESLLPQVLALVEKAGAAIMEVYARGDFETTYKKEGDSPLTRADLASNRLLVEGLRALTPTLPVLSEESKEIPYPERESWRRYWLIDPLDGTKEFIKRRDEFTVNVAMIERGEPAMGVVYAPAMEELYYASRGMGSFKRRGDEPPERILVSDYRVSGVTLVVSRSHPDARVEELVRKIGPSESLEIGSSLKLCLVAEGRAHLYPRFGPTMEWDIAAAQCVVEEAGGKVTDLSGRRLRYNKPSLENPPFIVCGAPPFPWQEYR